MKARIIKNSNGDIQLLCKNGTIMKYSENLLARLLISFHTEKFLNNLTGEEGRWTDTAFDMSDYPGETLAYVTDQMQMVFNSPMLLETIVSSVQIESKVDETVNYIMLSEYAKIHNRSEAMIRLFCQEGRISGARKNGSYWLIPENAPYPIPPLARKK